MGMSAWKHRDLTLEHAWHRDLQFTSSLFIEALI